MSYADKVLTCRECGAEFTFTAGEQEFYATRGLRNEPGRCPPCRASRRAQRSDGGHSIGVYSSRPPREMYEAICAECGSQTRVPFVPRDDKPVYCSPCYDKVRRR